MLLALPLAITLRDALAAHLGDSLAAETAATGVNYDWWQEFTAQASGLGTTFSPGIIGFATVLDNISRVLDGRRPIAPIAGAVALYLTGWAFLSGGILDRYARQRPIRTSGFFAASGVYFWRFLRLAAIAGLVYWWLFAYVHPWLFDTQFDSLTRGMSVERDAFLVRASFYVAFGVLLVALNITVDYAKVRMVVEDRRSAVGALAAALRFIRNHSGQVAALYALNSLTLLALLALWALVSPGAWSDRPLDVGSLSSRRSSTSSCGSVRSCSSWPRRSRFSRRTSRMRRMPRRQSRCGRSRRQQRPFVGERQCPAHAEACALRYPSRYPSRQNAHGRGAGFSPPPPSVKPWRLCRDDRSRLRRSSEFGVG